MTLAYLTARQLAARLQKQSLSSRDLLEMMIERNQHFGKQLNAIIYSDYDIARKRADAADAALARGESWGPLHGIPMCIKDTWEVAGFPTTAGSKRYKKHIPTHNAIAIDRLTKAGAIVFGKSNVPTFGTDIQSFNAIYGSSNNPWNLAHTPGGSSGGAAAAVAAGLTPLELGSDLAGSIRIPAHYCGVYSHKVTRGIIPLRGHIPGPPGALTEPDMVTAGPIARSVADLQMALDILAGPDTDKSDAWQLRLPPCGKTQLKDFKVLAWFDDPLCPLDQHLVTGYEKLLHKLETAGVQVDRGSPTGETLATYYALFLNLMGSILGSTMGSISRNTLYWSANLVAKVGRHYRRPPLIEHLMRGAGQNHVDWLHHNEVRLRLIEHFKQATADYDVVLMPITPTTAMPHQHRPELQFRHIIVNGEKRNYMENMMWVSVAALLGLPSTTVPLGLTAEKMPMGMQITAPPYRDKTTLGFAKLLDKITGGFTSPPGYDADSTPASRGSKTTTAIA